MLTIAKIAWHQN